MRWAESLDSAITQLLRARLGAISSGVTVTVEVQRCELNRANGNTVQLAATYAILPADGSAVAAQRGSFTTTARVWAGRDFEVLVGLLRAAIGDLSEAIAVAVVEKKS